MKIKDDDTVCSFVNIFVHSFVHSFVRSFVRSFVMTNEEQFPFPE